MKNEDSSLQNPTHNSQALDYESSLGSTVKGSTTYSVDTKADKDDQQENIASEPSDQVERLRLSYRPSLWGITIGLLIVIGSLLTLRGIMFVLSYAFGASVIVLALLPASVSPAKIRCGNCGLIFQEKLGQCPHCSLA